MADTYMKPNYSPTEGERLHHKAMQTGSAALLARLKAAHPAIVDRLIRKQEEHAQCLTHPLTAPTGDKPTISA